MAIYQAKGAGRGGICFFEDDIQAHARGRRAAEINLRNAIGRDELDAHFQPIIDLRTGRIVTCEALLRWNHPERGLMPAGEFIEIAEETGAIVQVGELVLEKACRACRDRPADVNVAVNVSPRQFDRADVSGTVRKALAETGLAPNRLETEITGTALLRNVTCVNDALRGLKELGVKISLDDFGSGYSSLSYLHSFPFDKVKLDRSFVANLASDSRSLTLIVGGASQRGATSAGCRQGNRDGRSTRTGPIRALLPRSPGFLLQPRGVAGCRQRDAARAVRGGGSASPARTGVMMCPGRALPARSRPAANFAMQPDDSRIACATVNVIHLMVAINLNP